jgi:hypothetical protein
VNCIYFIQNVIGNQACWFIGKIRMRLAAHGEPAAVKRSAVEPLNKVKILPVYTGSKSHLPDMRTHTDRRPIMSHLPPEKPQEASTTGFSRWILH